ncbi:hypothetical protein ACFL4G_09125 [Thermodesulfobacteriota bacterium]
MVKKLINKMEQIIETESAIHRKARKAINTPLKKKTFSVSAEEIDEILEGVEERISKRST